ncbi:MAG TPA: hypothetical protein VII50_00475, partial [Acidothermaceae bacterium]
MMLLVVEVPTLDHAGYIQKEAERLVGLAVRKALSELPRELMDKAYVSSVTATPFGEGSTCALLADEVQRLHAVIDVIKKPHEFSTPPAVGGGRGIEIKVVDDKCELRVVRSKTKEVVHRVDVSGRSDGMIEKVMSG